MEDLLAELEAAQKAEKDNEKRADALTPRSQEAYADAGDTKRATRDVPDEMGALEDELKGGFSVSVWNKICGRNMNLPFLFLCLTYSEFRRPEKLQ